MAAIPPPVFELPSTPEPRKNSYVWFGLFAAFALLIVVAVAGYFGASPTKKTNYDEIESEMRQEATTRAFNEWLGIKSERSSTDQKSIKLLAEAKDTDILAAKLYVTSKFSAGEKVAPEDLQKISQSTDPADKAFAQIYSSDKLTPDEGTRLGQSLPKEPFVNTFARIQALEKAGVNDPYLKIITVDKVRIFGAAVGAIALVVLIGSGLWVIYFAARSAGKLIPLGHPSDPMTRLESERYALRTLQFLLGYVSVSVLAIMVVQRIIPKVPHMSTELLENRNLIAELFATMGTVLLIPFLYFVPTLGRRISARSQGWHTENLGKNILWGLAAAFANGPVLVVLALIGSALFSWLPVKAHPIELEVENSRNLISLLIAGVSASIGAPIFEETLFRGTLLPALTTKFGSAVWGVVVSSLFFAAMHPTGPPAWLPLAGIGAVSAMLTYQTKSLVPSVVMHAAHNLATLLFALAIS